MAAFDALFSLAQITDRTRNQAIRLFEYGAKEKIDSIHNLVAFLLRFLEECPEKAKLREGSFRDVAYDIEYIIEKYMWDLHWQSQSGDNGRMNNFHLAFEGQLKIELGKIGEIAGEVTEERPVVSSSSTSTLPPIGSSDTVVGLDTDLMAIKKLLCEEQPKRQVIPIVGMGGIGKTTLATTVYNDTFIINHFDVRVWLTVSQDYRFGKILSGLVDALKLPQELMSGDQSEIKLQVRQHLWRRRYLIIMDDVWGREIWDDVMVMFPDNENRSRIMFTTRQLDVASYPARHKMQLMNESQSWDLLKLKVFSNSKCPPELEDAGKEIARRCAGLPLAVVLVAGFLPAQVNETLFSSWRKFAETIDPVVNGKVEEILSLSYTYLPHHLRPCFLLIGGLQDAYIQTSRLTKLLVAEGFMKHQSDFGKTLEEKAEEYLEDLVKRNLVIVASRKGDGKIKRCNLHDLVRELCRRKAHEEKFLNVMDGHHLPQGLMNERRISYTGSDIDDIWCPTIHTILCFQIQNFPGWLASLRNYKVLRVLDVLGIDLKELPPQVFELYHIRYIALQGFLEIPSDISNLVNLQTLIIHLAFKNLWSIYDKGEYHSLPLEIWRMPQLRHLVFNAPYMLLHPPDGLSSPLENLQTLLLVRNLDWDGHISQMIPNVKRLGLVYTTTEEFHIHRLKNLRRLEKLEVIGCRYFWRWESPSFPMTLRKLILVGGSYPWRKMGIIGSLPNLEVLKLLDYACDGDTWETTDGEFPRLNYLLIDESEIQEWITESRPFPRLKHLVLRSCGKLTGIPLEIGDIPTLELIEVDGSCTMSLLESARVMKEEQEYNGNDALEVRIAHKLHGVETEEDMQQQVIQSLNIRIGPEDQLKNVSEKISLIAGEMTDDVRPASLPIDVSSSSRLAPISSDVVIGIHDNDLREIKGRLCEQSSKLQVIPIVGKGGIGKTTLARAAYDDPSIMRHFQIRVWVTVSQDYTPQVVIGHVLHSVKLLEEPKSRLEYGQSEVVEEVCEKLMAQILGKEIDNSEMAKQVHQMLEGKRYLIIMDNLRSTKVWDDVRNIFPDDDNGSRIMLTTRLSDVATYPDSSSPLHQMMLMNDDQSRNLLWEKTYWYENFSAVGEEIARKCAGLPLAVVLVAGVLYGVSESSRGSWKDNDLNLSSVELELGDIPSCSYTHLPRRLRRCFLFMGGFPENRSIRASRLIKLWVAEGCLERESLKEEEDWSFGWGWKDKEKEAEMYLEQLVKRNLVIVTSRTSSGKIKSCRLHDMVRDMCRRKADEEKFLKDPATRSILCFHLQKIPPIWVAFSGGFRLLKAWDAIQKELPLQVFELVDLRYLSLNASLDIPSAISKLANLQTLIIHPTLSLRKRYGMYDEPSSHFSLPVEIWRLRKLRHLIFYDLFMLPHPPETSNSPLDSLQTLWRVKNLEWTKEILRMIPNVKKLGLAYNDTFEDYGLHHLEHLLQLEKLELYGSEGFSWRGQNLRFPLALKKLTLVGGVFPWADMGIIGSLPNLQVLKLLDHVCDDETWETAGDEFCNLEFLQIEGSRLSQWKTQSGHFPSLKNLVIGSCRFLMEIPQCMGDIWSLEFIHLDYNSSESLVRSANQLQRDKGKYAFQLRRYSSELLNEELHERPIEELQPPETGEAQVEVAEVATGDAVMETAENCGSIFRLILEKTMVICATGLTNVCRSRGGDSSGVSD